MVSLIISRIMENKIRRLLDKCFPFLIIAFLIACTYVYRQTKETRENARLEKNQAALVDSVRHRKTETGKEVASVQSVTVNNSEFKEQFQDLNDMVKDLGLKLKRVQQINKASSETKIKAATDLKDSIIYVDSSAYKIQVIRYSDPWVNVEGILDKKKVSLDIVSRDTLYTVLHRVPKKFLFFKFGTKCIRQEIVSSNPHTRITFARTVLLEK